LCKLTQIKRLFWFSVRMSAERIALDFTQAETDLKNLKTSKPLRFEGIKTI